MIIVQLKGGIGNQMFQYAAARRISHIHNVPLKLDIHWFNTVSPDTRRKYELHVFNIREDFATLKEINKLRGLTAEGKPTLRHRIRKKFLPDYKRSKIVERHFHFDPHVLKPENNIYLEGYWQSEQYFKDIENIVRKEFTVKAELDAINKNLAKEIMSSESVSIHVRRGDYVSNEMTRQHHGICSIEYYHTAIDKIAEKIKEPHFFVFSDEPDWVKKYLKPECPVTYIDFNGEERAYEDLRLMIQCKHHIIANSTFSWWGAWLSQNKNKIVFAPAKWFNDSSIDTKDLIPDGWLKI